MAFSIVCLSYLGFSLLFAYSAGYFPQSSLLSSQTYLRTSTTKRQASQAYTTSRLVLGSRQRLNSMHDFWIVSIYTLRTRKVALESPSLDCVSFIFFFLFFPDAVVLIHHQLPSDNGPCKYCTSHWTDSCRMGGTRSLALDSNGHCAFNFYNGVLNFPDLNNFFFFRG